MAKKERDLVKDHLFVLAIVLLVIIGMVNMFSDASLMNFAKDEAPELFEDLTTKGVLAKTTGLTIKALPGEDKKAAPLTGWEWVEGGAYFVLLLAIIGGLFSFANVSVKIQEKVDSRQTMAQYVLLARQAGFNEGEIQKRLEGQGHSSEEVYGAMKKEPNEQGDIPISLRVK